MLKHVPYFLSRVHRETRLARAPRRRWAPDEIPEEVGQDWEEAGSVRALALPGVPGVLQPLAGVLKNEPFANIRFSLMSSVRARLPVAVQCACCVFARMGSLTTAISKLSARSAAMRAGDSAPPLRWVQHAR